MPNKIPASAIALIMTTAAQAGHITLTSAVAINDSGEILVNGTDSNLQYGSIALIMTPTN